MTQTIERKNIMLMSDGILDKIKAEVRGFEIYLSEKYKFAARLDVSTEQGIVHSQLETMNMIRDIVFGYYDVDVSYYTKRSRIREAVLCRQICMTFCSEEFKVASLKVIGMYFGGRDHSTVVHAKTTINDLRETDKNFNLTYKHLIELCKSRGL